MIGNDIVDLALAKKESNWQRKDFLDKIFTKDEQLLISNSDNPETMVWNLWSRKEAAYKIYNRETLVRGYFPLQLECFDLEIRNEVHYGKVLIKEKCYFTKTEIKTEFIHTVALTDAIYFDKIKVLNYTKEIIQKKDGIPFIVANDNSLRPVSISHHGKFERIVTL